MGHRAERTLVQSDSLDRDTRTEIWNTIVILKQVFQNVRDETYGSDTTESNVLEAVWTWEFKQARDEMRSHGQVWEHIKIYVLNEKWFDVLDLVEALVGYLGRYKTHSTAIWSRRSPRASTTASSISSWAFDSSGKR